MPTPVPLTRPSKYTPGQLYCTVSPAPLTRPAVCTCPSTPDTRISCHCWLAPPQSVNCTILAPSAVEAFCTSTALPLLRLISRT
ncbi:hypothetical protein QF035_010452 [Streptomyces umbrinus]|uniref:Uncharacterized protein n=1 Tax=Streptomyces umbrinus TaxID=67370 RepID=A0ABU0TAM2_9ACTN|nr:hypothetical protein [Streptomyces umbrinus]